MNELYYALVALMEAKHQRDKARDEYDGYSWGYHGQSYETAVDEAEKRFRDGFKDAVREALSEIANETPNSGHAAPKRGDVECPTRVTVNATTAQ